MMLYPVAVEIVEDEYSGCDSPGQRIFGIKRNQRRRHAENGAFADF